MSFGLKKFAASAERTAEFTLDTISDDPGNPVKLTVRHAGESNAAYMSAVLKGANELRARSGRGRATAAAIQMNREEDAALFAAHVVTGWKNVQEDGKPAPFDVETCERFLLELVAARPDTFGALVAFCQNADNFRDPVASSESLGKG